MKWHHLYNQTINQAQDVFQGVIPPNFYILFVLLALGMISCDKNEDVQPNENSEPKAINEGNGFSTVSILESGGYPNDYSLADMTISSDGKALILATWTSTNLPTYILTTMGKYRVTIADGTIDTIKTPPSWKPNIQHYRRELGSYNGSFIYGTERLYEAYSFSSGWVAYVTVVGDGFEEYFYHHSISKFAPFRVTRHEEVVHKLYGDEYDYIYLDYQNKDRELHSFVFKSLERFRPDRYIYTGDTYPIGGTGQDLIMFAVDHKYMSVMELAIDDLEKVEGFNYHKFPVAFDSLAIPDSWGNVHIGTKISHDERKIGIVLRNTEAPYQFITASYDIASQNLTLNNNNITIPNYTSGLINYDIDELGNIWFDNFGDDFQNEDIISIYKASNSNFSEVGRDLLAGGTITDFRYLNGKIYAVVTYRIQVGDYKTYRMAIIQED